MSDILVVDDDKVCLDFMKVYLKSQGYSVAMAEDGQEGFEKAKTENPRLIILDFMMPKWDGYKLTQILKSDPATKNIPIIMLTALSKYVEALKASDVGVSDFLVKPCHPKTMLAAVSKHICKTDQEDRPS